MATMNLLAQPLTEIQERELKELFKDSFTLRNEVWDSVKSAHKFPNTIAQLETIMDNDMGLSQPQLDAFLDEVESGRRCVTCGEADKGTDDICTDCVIELDEAVGA